MPTTPASDVVLRALSIGAAASEALSRAGAALRVHSVFRSTMNLVVEGTDTLVALTGAAGLPYAHAVVLAEDEDFRSWPHPAGSTGLLDGAFLRLRWRGNSRAVDLGRARRQPSRLLPSVRRRGSAWRACARTLSRFQADHGCDLLLSGLSGSAGAATVMGEALHRSARALGAAISADGAPPAAVRHAVSSLAGKGTVSPLRGMISCAASWLPRDAPAAAQMPRGTVAAGTRQGAAGRAGLHAGRGRPGKHPLDERDQRLDAAVRAAGSVADTARGPGRWRLQRKGSSRRSAPSVTCAGSDTARAPISRRASCTACAS